jgi:hypothetical protein
MTEDPVPPKLRALTALTDRAEDFLAGPPAEPVLAHRDPAVLGGLLSMTAVEDMLADHALSYPLLTVSRDGRSLPSRTYTHAGRPARPGARNPGRDLPDLVAIRDQLAAGSTLVLELLHRTHRPLAAFCRRLGYELNRPVPAAAFLSPRNAQGFGLHHDTAGVFTVQCEGHKTWQVYRPAVAFPLDGQRFHPGLLTAQDRAAMERDGPHATFELGPGDVLWLPRGWLHNVFTTDDVSLHLTIGVPEVSRHQMLALLLVSLADDEEFRLDLPFDTFTSAGRAREEAELTLKSFTAWLAQVDPADLARRAGAALHDAWDPPARSSPITAVIRSDAELAAAAGLRVVREAVITLDHGPGGSLRLGTGAGELTLDPPAAAFVGALLAADDEAPVPVERFRAALGEDTHRVLRALLGEGVVELVR